MDAVDSMNNDFEKCWDCGQSEDKQDQDVDINNGLFVIRMNTFLKYLIILSGVSNDTFADMIQIKKCEFNDILHHDDFIYGYEFYKYLSTFEKILKQENNMALAVLFDRLFNNSKPLSETFKDDLESICNQIQNNEILTDTKLYIMVSEICKK